MTVKIKYALKRDPHGYDYKVEAPFIGVTLCDAETMVISGHLTEAEAIERKNAIWIITGVSQYNRVEDTDNEKSS